MEGNQTPAPTPATLAQIDPNAKPLTAEALPQLLPDPTDTTSARSEWARRALRHAWFQVFGSDAAAPYNRALEQGILAIADVETNLGRSVWSDPVDGAGYSLRWNFGNVHCAAPAVAGVCISGCKKHGDTTADGTPYTVCFAAYKSAVDGMAGLVRTLCGKGRENTRAALLSGDAMKIADAMRANSYYGKAIELRPQTMSYDAAIKAGYSTPEQRDTYAKAIETRVKTIADHLGDPVAVAVGGVSSSGALVVGVGLALAGLATWYAIHKGA